MMINRNAIFSSDRKYRYVLERQWDAFNPFIMFIGLNPSTANEKEDDPTIRRLIGFAKRWGYGGLYMTNLYAYVSTNPDELDTSGEDLLKTNYELKETSVISEKVVFCWGCFKQHKNRMNAVIQMFPDAYCIDLSKDGYPKHPLYLKSDLQLKKFNSKLQ